MRILGNMKKLIRFGIIGGCTTLIDWCIYWFLSRKVDVTVAKITSMLLASVFSYVFNKFWTFENSDKNHGKYLWKYYITYVINITINTTINTVIYKITERKFWALLIATGGATMVNFLLQTFWVFRGKDKEEI